MELITKSFANQCLAFPDRVDQVLATISTIEEATKLLRQASAMQSAIEQLRMGIESGRPVAYGVLKIKAKLGEMMPAKPPSERGQGRNGKESILSDRNDLTFDKNTWTAYRKLAAHKDRLQEYYESIDDIPTQTDFIKSIEQPHVSNNSGENEWYTPSEYIEAARQVMGSIDLDPASSKTANQIVKAKKFYTLDDDGLSKKWTGNVWLNPPYASGLVEQFTRKLFEEWINGRTKSAVVLLNNATETQWFQSLLVECSAICFIAGRIKFLDATLEPKKTPLQGQAAVYFGKDRDGFARAFAELGCCMEGS